MADVTARKSKLKMRFLPRIEEEIRSTKEKLRLLEEIKEDERCRNLELQTLQMVVIQGPCFSAEDPPTHRLGYDEPIYGGPFSKRPDNQQGYVLLKRLGFHGFTCVEYLRDTFYRSSGDKGKSWIPKQLVVIHNLLICETEEGARRLRMGREA